MQIKAAWSETTEFISILSRISGRGWTVTRTPRAGACPRWPRAFRMPPFSRVGHRAYAGRLLAFLLVTAVLSACVAPSVVTDEMRAAEETARAYFSSHDYRAAAHAYLRLAASAPSPKAEEYRLRAAEALIAGQALDPARALLKETKVAGLPVGVRARKDIVMAQLALAENRPQDALAQLRTNYGEALPTPEDQLLRRTRAQAYAQAANPIEAARERVALELVLMDEEAIEANRQAIWALVNSLQPAILEAVSLPPPDTLGGWLELVAIGRQYARDYRTASAAIDQWRLRYPGHPAAQRVVPELLDGLRYGVTRPRHIALLLPQEGRFAQAASAVEDGFIAAWFQDVNGEEPPPILSIYSASPENLWTVYQEAVGAGADFVVGPLDKASVTLLARTERLQLPTLALNKAAADDPLPAEMPAQEQEVLPGAETASQTLPIVRVSQETPSAGLPGQMGTNTMRPAPAPTKGLYQFALSPEDEATQAAERAWLDGHTRAAVIAPDSEWGERVAGAFRDAWETRGGIVVATQAYGKSDQDIAGAVKRLMNIDQSEQRARQLIAQLGKRIEYEPRRRQDVDLVFMAAFARQARQLRPQLKFYRASDLPVYATSHVYSGKSSPRQDRDLDGVMFGDMPWVISPDVAEPALQQAIQQSWADTAATYNRLVAFGVDAYRLIPHLRRLQVQPYAPFEGVTGSIVLDDSNRVSRALEWAQFRRGRAQPLETDIPFP